MQAANVSLFSCLTMFPPVCASAALLCSYTVDRLTVALARFSFGTLWIVFFIFLLKASKNINKTTSYMVSLKNILKVCSEDIF